MYFIQTTNLLLVLPLHCREVSRFCTATSKFHLIDTVVDGLGNCGMWGNLAQLITVLGWCRNQNGAQLYPFTMLLSGRLRHSFATFFLLSVLSGHFLHLLIQHIFRFTLTFVAGGNSSLLWMLLPEATPSTSTLIFLLLSPVRIRMIVSFDPDNLVSYEGPVLDISDHDPVNWDAWLTPEALRDETNPSQLLLQHVPQLYSERPEVPLPSQEDLQIMQPLDSTKEHMTTNLRTPSPGVYDSEKCESTIHPPLVNRENEQPKPLEPCGALSSADYSQEPFLTSPDFEFLKVQISKERPPTMPSRSIIGPTQISILTAFINYVKLQPARH